jgi:DNA-directed RNA polymerase subunit K/omega
MSDISLEDLSQKTSNIYAAVVVMSKRARQVTDEQKTIIDSEKEVVPYVENKENEDFGEVEIDREALMRNHRKFPKPVRVAIEEMIKSKISWEIQIPESQN